MEKFFHPLDDDVHAYGLGVDDLLPAESEEALRESGGPPCCGEHLAEVRPQGVALRNFDEGDVPIADDRGEDVVEVMGDPAGKLSHGLHFLRVTELLLELGRA